MGLDNFWIEMKDASLEQDVPLDKEYLEKASDRPIEDDLTQIDVEYIAKDLNREDPLKGLLSEAIYAQINMFNEHAKREDCLVDAAWMKRQDAAINLDPPVNLCGGMFSGTGGSSFRGKRYSELIERASGLSLYESLLENRDVWCISDALEIFLESFEEDEDSFAKEEVEDLARMFHAHAEAGHCLESWY